MPAASRAAGGGPLPKYPVQASSITYRVLKGADHGLTSEDSQRAYTRLLLGWLREMVTEARTGPAVPARPSKPSSVAKTPHHDDGLEPDSLARQETREAVMAGDDDDNDPQVIAASAPPMHKSR